LDEFGLDESTPVSVPAPAGIRNAACGKVVVSEFLFRVSCNTSLLSEVLGEDLAWNRGESVRDPALKGDLPAKDTEVLRGSFKECGTSLIAFKDDFEL